MYNCFNRRGFTLIELLLVIAILAILAAAIIPNFIGFDKEARVSTTKSNLDVLRGRVLLYRAKQGAYPVNLTVLTTTTYQDGTVTKTYLDKMPKEFISIKTGSNAIAAALGTGGGWYYDATTAKIQVNYNQALTAEWGSFAGDNPAIDW